MLNRETIYQEGAPKTKEVPIPEWGGSVTIRSLSADEAMALAEYRGQKTVVSRYIAASVIGEDGQRVFPDDDDIAKIGSLGAKGNLRLYRAIEELNGMDSEDVEKN